MTAGEHQISGAAPGPTFEPVWNQRLLAEYPEDRAQYEGTRRILFHTAPPPPPIGYCMAGPIRSSPVLFPLNLKTRDPFTEVRFMGLLVHVQCWLFRWPTPARGVFWSPIVFPSPFSSPSSSTSSTSIPYSLMLNLLSF